MKNRMILFLVIVLVGGSCPEASAQGPPAASAGRFGLSLSAAVVPFLGGDSGPETPISQTNYYDTFDTGWGGRLEVFYDWTAMLRVHLGVVHNEWSGKYFTGGEFPQGAQFGDLDLTAFYIGCKVRFAEGSRLRPYLLGNLGVVQVSSVDITTGGNTLPYWSSTTTSFLDLGAGIEYTFSKHVAAFIDVRVEIFGTPDSAMGFMAEGTGSDSLPVSIGIDILF